MHTEYAGNLTLPFHKCKGWQKYSFEIDVLFLQIISSKRLYLMALFDVDFCGIINVNVIYILLQRKTVVPDAYYAQMSVKTYRGKISVYTHTSNKYRGYACIWG